MLLSLVEGKRPFLQSRLRYFCTYPISYFQVNVVAPLPPFACRLLSILVLLYLSAQNNHITQYICLTTTVVFLKSTYQLNFIITFQCKSYLKNVI